MMTMQQNLEIFYQVIAAIGIAITCVAGWCVGAVGLNVLVDWIGERLGNRP